MLLAADFSLLLTQNFIPFQRTGRINIFCVGGAKVPNKYMCSRSSSLTAPALGAAQTSNTYMCPVTSHATVGADLFVPTLSGFAGNLRTLSTQAKASHSRDTARKGFATLLLLQGGGTTLMLGI